VTDNGALKTLQDRVDDVLREHATAQGIVDQTDARLTTIEADAVAAGVDPSGLTIRYES
jgi:hypothetical protein